jgi:hypothetical protein
MPRPCRALEPDLHFATIKRRNTLLSSDIAVILRRKNSSAKTKVKKNENNFIKTRKTFFQIVSET